MREVLFLCTGNYYRSRYAEALFNYEAHRRGLEWRAFSRGLAIHLAPPGGLSPHAIQRLQERRISPAHTGLNPVQVKDEDFRRAARTIALKETEHRRLLAAQYPRWEKRVEYWEVGDLDSTLPAEAMTTIERHVAALLDEVATAGDA